MLVRRTAWSLNFMEELHYRPEIFFDAAVAQENVDALRRTRERPEAEAMAKRFRKKHQDAVRRTADGTATETSSVVFIDPVLSMESMVYISNWTRVRVANLFAGQEPASTTAARAKQPATPIGALDLEGGGLLAHHCPKPAN